MHVDMFDDRLEIVSPGGMLDGKPVQEYDIDTIPSMRRNPLLADIFARLKLMERSGSGLGKIRDAQRHSANFVPAKDPIFYSDKSQFRITLLNLNYKNEKMAELTGKDNMGVRTDQVTGQVVDQVTGQVTGQVVGQVMLPDLIDYCKLPRTRAELQDYCGLSGRSNFREKYLNPLLQRGLIKMTIPDKPNSKNQKYYSG